MDAMARMPAVAALDSRPCRIRECLSVSAEHSGRSQVAAFGSRPD